MPLRTKQYKHILKQKIIPGLLFTFSAIALSACANSAKDVANSLVKKTNVDSAREYGAIPIPKPAMTKTSDVVRGGGRAIVGTPYRVRGKWYYPKEEHGYQKIGRASWYGSTFHGRLTANGETYDMHHLTAAHPTMPLPSYARVTNLENGSSVIVRVNDRGPYAKDRIIDLSKQAAKMLDYKDSGTANVKVEYVGKAPVEGNDDAYLMASYKPGGNASDVLLAMSEIKRGSESERTAEAFSGVVNTATDTAIPNLPQVGPVLTEKPQAPQWAAYAEEKTNPTVFERFNTALSPATEHYSNDDEIQAIELGSFTDKSKVAILCSRLQNAGSVSVEKTTDEQLGSSYHLKLTGFTNPDDALRLAWASGATDAFLVRSTE
ncbi:septal ring lytic transglycosylase RlpA family protein [Bartonella sp. LJL80]